jgi:dienelactone hydrolase
MKSRRSTCLLYPLVMLGLLLPGCATVVPDLRQGQSGSVAWQHQREDIKLVGKLALPPRSDGRAKVPAVIVVHASGGVDARNERWSRLLLEAGYATFQLDYFGPRGITAMSRVQPTPVFDVAESLKLLATHPRIDSNRIAVIGFSRGATMALESMNFTPADAGGHTLAAHVALYPDCMRTYVRAGSQAPVLVLAAEGDDIHPPLFCQLFAERARDLGRNFRLAVYEGAAHGWDGDFSGTWFHPAAGRAYTMVANDRLAQRSYREVLQFLDAALRGGS